MTGNRCEQHMHEYKAKRAEYQKTTNSRRTEHHEFYKTYYWKMLSQRYLKYNPLCVMCKEEGRTTPAKHTDHIVPIAEDPDRARDWSNFRALCISCHSKHGGRVMRSQKLSD